MPTLNLPPVDHGAFLAVAVSDGDAACASLLSRTDAGLFVEEGAQTDTREILHADAVGVPSDGCVVRLRLYRRGKSALITALGSDATSLGMLSQVLDQALADAPLNLPLTTTSAAPRPPEIQRNQAQGSVPRDTFDILVALGTGDPCAALARIVAAGLGAPTQSTTICAVPPSGWPCTPRSIMESTDQTANAMVSVAISDSPPNDRFRRELERHAPDQHGQVCSITAVRSSSTVQLVVRTIPTVDPAVVLHTLISAMTRWASAPDTPVPAAEVGTVLRHPESGSDADDTGPCNEQEQLLIDQVRLVLHLPDDQITLRSNFFALGGDSMSALQLATALGTHGWQADVKDVFLSPDLRSLAATLVPGPTGQPEVTPLTASGLDQKILDRLLDEDKA